MTRVVDVGEGRLVPYVDQPIVEPPRARKNTARGKVYAKRYGGPPEAIESLEKKPGWFDWASMRRKQLYAATGVPTTLKKPGRIAGVLNGKTFAQTQVALKRGRKIAMEDMKNIKAKVDPIEDDKAEEALTTTLTILRTKDVALTTKLAAARLLLDFTKSKPSSKSEVTVKSAEDWLAQIADDSEQPD